MPGEQFPSRPEIRGHQLAELRRLLAALAGNPFYLGKLDGVPRWDSIASLEQFSVLFPFTRKEELVADQRAHPPYGTNLGAPLAGYTRCHQTSGTGGQPLRWLDTPRNWRWMISNWREIYQAAGVGPADRVYFAFSFGPFIGFWLAFEAAAELGCLCIPGGGQSTTARLQSILGHEATVICCTPTYAIRLAETAREEGIDPTRLAVRTIIVAGEPGGSIPATRARLEHLWPGVRIFDHHGMTEVGPVTYECPARPGRLHVVERGYLAEVIEPDGSQPTVPGSQGELVLTTLGRLDSPLLRYRTGDLVVAPDQQAGRCACGRAEMALDGGILGRVDDMVVVRGVNVYPGAVEEIVRGCPGVAEYQVVLDEAAAMRELLLRVEPEPACADVPALLLQLEKRFQVALALRVRTEAAPTGSLPRFEMKAKRWVRKAPAS